MAAARVSMLTLGLLLGLGLLAMRARPAADVHAQTAVPPPAPSGQCTRAGEDITGVDTQTGALLSELAGQGMAITYKAGWNLIGLPEGTLITAPRPPEVVLYTLRPGDTSYRLVSASQPLQGGTGYWWRIPQDYTQFVRVYAPMTKIVPVPPGQYVTIGNPGSTPATVSGADQVLSYDPVGGRYQETTTLQPGQGALVFSANGSQVTIANLPGVDAPAAPIRLTATVLDASSVRLDWAHDGNNVDGFSICSVNNGQSVAIAGADSRARAYTVRGLDPFSRYCFFVVAVNRSGPSDPTDQACATTPQQ